MTRAAARWSLLLLLSLVTISGCRTPGGIERPTELELRVAEYLAALAGRHEAVSALRARARTEVEGASGEAFSRQLLLLERPARMRVEVMGLLGQRALVLATNGETYEVFRAESPGIERGDRPVFGVSSMASPKQGRTVMSSC